MSKWKTAELLLYRDKLSASMLRQGTCLHSCARMSAEMTAIAAVDRTSKTVLPAKSTTETSVTTQLQFNSEKPVANSTSRTKVVEDFPHDFKHCLHSISASALRGIRRIPIIMIHIVVSTLISGLVLLLVASITRNNSSGLKGIPNAHFTAPYSRIWLLAVRWRSRENRTRIDLHRRLGPIVRIGPREVSVDCVDEGIHLIYSSKFVKHEWYHRAFSDSDVPFMVIMLGNEEHKERKKMLSNVYSKSSVLKSKSLDKSLSSKLAYWQENMADWGSNGNPIETIAEIKACMLDVTTGWLYGVENSTDTLRDRKSRDELSTMIEQSWRGIFWRGDFHWLTEALTSLGIDLDPRSGRIARSNLKIWSKKMTESALGIHEDKSSPAATVYDHFHDNLNVANPKLTPHDANTLMAAELYDHLLATYEGGGIAITYAMYELSRHPERQRALRKELSTLAEESSRSRAQRIDELPILDAVLTETLRVRSPGPGPWPRTVPESGCRLAGHYDVPGGTVVSSTSWTLHRNPTVFPSPEEWRPERWLEADEATKYEMRKWFWAFGSGARMCIGVHFAIRIFKEMLVAIYTDYETILDDDFTGDMEQVDALIAGPISSSLNLKFRRHT